MGSAIICLLLVVACWLACFEGTSAECCVSSLTITYRVVGENCGVVGGTRDGSDCTVTICANGTPQVGTFCGKGSCNAFGCNCDRGCLSGHWAQGFIDQNSGTVGNPSDIVKKIPFTKIFDLFGKKI